MADGMFGTLVQNMARLGFFQFLFPFLLALAIVYGLLSWALEKQLPKSARALIALIAAFFVMLYSAWNVMVVEFFSAIFGQFLAVATGILVIVMLFALVGFRVDTLFGDKSKSKWVLILLIVFIGIVLFFGAGAAWLINIPGVVMGTDFWTVIFFIIILAIVMFWLSQESGGGAPAGGEKK